MLACATSAAAQPSGGTRADKKRAEALFREAIEDVQGKRFDAACPKFRESQELDPAPGTLFNLARCEEDRGRLAAAHRAFEELLRSLPLRDRRAADVQQRIDALEPRVPRLTVKLREDAPAGTTVTRDGEPLGPDALGATLHVDPGKHVVVAESEGKSRSFEVKLAPFESKALEVTPLPDEKPVEAATKRPAVAARPPDASEGSGRATSGIVLAGVGLVGVGIGVFAGVSVLDADSELAALCDEGGVRDDFCPGASPSAVSALNSRGKTMAIVSPIGFGVGLLGLGAGAYLLLTSGQAGGREGKKGAHGGRTVVRADASPGRTWIGLSRSF